MAAPVMPGSTKPEAFWYERRVGDRPQSVREGRLARRLLTSREEDWGGAPSEVIVTQDLCDVCAVAFGDVCAAAAALVYHPIRIVNLHPRRLDDIWADIGRFAEARDWYHYIFNPIGEEHPPGSGSDLSPMRRFWITKPFFQRQ